MGKYQSFETVVEYREDTSNGWEVIPIARAGDSEKAHFLATAANSYREPTFDTEHTMLIGRIRQWAEDRNLIKGATSQAQTVKLFEEGGEVAAAVAKGNLPALKDGIGDMVVVLVILAAQNGLTFEECVAAAYDEIKDRTGRMVNGIFVRD